MSQSATLDIVRNLVLASFPTATTAHLEINLGTEGGYVVTGVTTPSGQGEREAVLDLQDVTWSLTTALRDLTLPGLTVLRGGENLDLDLAVH